MEIDYVNANDKDFNAELYIRALVAIAKSDRFNGPPEYEYVKNLARRLSVDMVSIWNDTGRNFSIEIRNVSRMTAMLLIKDCIMLASLDGNYSLDEKQRVYGYAEKMDIPRTDVDAIEAWLGEYRKLHTRWEALIAHGLAEAPVP